MRSLIIYFSLEGHTRLVAELIAKEVNADLVELQTVKEYPRKGFKKYFWCGKAAVFREKPELKTKLPDLNKYDLILIGTPVWAGNCTPPINTLLSKCTIVGKKVALFITNGGGSISRCTKQISKALSGNTLLKPIHFVNPVEEEREKLSQKIKQWLKEIGCLE